MTKQRYMELKEALLRELAHTPRSYMQPEGALLSGVSLAVAPTTTQAKWEDALLALRAGGLAAREYSDARECALYAITPLSRRHAAELGVD